MAASWPPTIFVDPLDDHVPGSGHTLISRAVEELEDAGAKDVMSIEVEGATHMFDMPPMVGTSDRGVKWEAVVRAMDFVVKNLDV